MNKIYIVGFMACGKSTLGAEIAKELKFEFEDLDELLEVKFGRSIAEMFQNWGEKKFRELEKEALRNLTARNHVLACGGGTPCFFDNIDFMLRQGTVIYLKQDPKVLAKRIRESDTIRPLFARVSDKDLEAEVKRLLKEREPFYSKAHVTVEGESISAKEVINMLQ